MSHYACPVCTGPTSVVETRRSKKGLRRRRRCDKNHRFTTVEVPHDTGKRSIKLIQWLTDKLDPEIADFALEEMKAIMAGIPEEPDDVDEETPIHSSGPSDGPHPGSLGERLIEALEEAIETTGSPAYLLSGGIAPASSEGTGPGTPRSQD